MINRPDWWRWIPGYRFGAPCVRDLSAAVFFAMLVFLIFSRRRTEAV